MHSLSAQCTVHTHTHRNRFIYIHKVNCFRKKKYSIRPIDRENALSFNLACILSGSTSDETNKTVLVLFYLIRFNSVWFAQFLFTIFGMNEIKTELLQIFTFNISKCNAKTNTNDANNERIYKQMSTKATHTHTHTPGHK